MEDFWDIAIPLGALIGSMTLAAVLLSRARSHAKPDEAEAGPPIPVAASRRQRRILEKLEPLREPPTLMDLVREEIAELGIEEIPGHEGVSGPVLLKVYRRDHPAVASCEHGSLRFEVESGTDPGAAEEEDVSLTCPECPTLGTNPED